jgi:type IV fimbrial biogenesis protein FimT
MNSGKHKSGTRSRNGFPFICLNRPFVGYNITSVYPFVWKKLPFVSFRGFTLVELIITLTIAGILMAVAAPALQTFVTSNRLSSQINDIMADITHARNEAIKRSVLTGICTTAVGGTSCVASGNWANGWLVYYCANETSTITCAASEKTTIKLHEQLTGNNTLTGPASEIIYRKDGIIQSGTGQFTLTDPKTGKKRIVCIVNTGRPSLSEDNC